ncbi:MAG: hypothetical protein DI539_01850 [Flavobacterium psychrophilum]|nr:MAG: hypothetical protein DI539_01850 [Flavobacterium psychrophilum]
MKKILSLLAGLFITGTSISQNIATDNKKISELDQTVDKAVTKFLADKNNAGVSIAVISDGRVNFYNYGEAEKKSGKLPGQATIYEIGSISKTFTGILLSKAVEDKKIALDEDIRNYLPQSCAGLSYNGLPILVSQLTNHTSGLPRLASNLSEQPNFNELNPYKNYDKNLLIAYLSTVKIINRPGTFQEYSNTGTALLGMIIEKAYGKTYDQLVKEFITGPLKMNSTFINASHDKVSLMAKGYYQGNVNPYWDFSDLPAAGALKSTATDLSLYLKANIDESLPYIKNSHTVTFEQGQRATAYNWFIDTLKTGDKLVWHNGGTYGFSSFIGYLKDKKCGVVVLANSFSEGGPDNIGISILKALSEVKQ